MDRISHRVLRDSGICVKFVAYSRVLLLRLSGGGGLIIFVMSVTDVEELLRKAGVAPTPNRVLVLRAIAEAHHPMSLMELETELETLEKSSIFRVLNLLERESLVHAMQDGRGVAKYEICHCSGHGHSEEDMHIHFYCSNCRETFCFEDMAVPAVTVPEGFCVESVNYMLKGLCPTCSKSHNTRHNH